MVITCDKKIMLTKNIGFKKRIKSTLQVLRQFLASESPFKNMKNAFYFTLKALFGSQNYSIL